MLPSGDTTDSEGATVNRRDVLKIIGAGAGAVVVATGTASATRNKFYGCSQVCADSKGIEAVVATDDGYECREMNRTSNRGDVPWDYDSHCYEVSDGEAIVGVVEACHFCENPKTAPATTTTASRTSSTTSKAPVANAPRSTPTATVASSGTGMVTATGTGTNDGRRGSVPGSSRRGSGQRSLGGPRDGVSQ
jgi:hypothetical protein